jgi:hypothetical protein
MIARLLLIASLWLAATIAGALFWVNPSSPQTPPRTETFSWAMSEGATAYRLYRCASNCWNVNRIPTAWRRVAESTTPGFTVPIPDSRTWWMAAAVYRDPDREVFRWNAVWYTVPGPKFVTVPPP